MFGVLALNLAFFVSEAADRQTDRQTGWGKAVNIIYVCVCVWEEGVSEISVSVRKGL